MNELEDSFDFADPAVLVGVWANNTRTVAATSSQSISSAMLPNGHAASSSLVRSYLPSSPSSFATSWTKRGEATLSGPCRTTRMMDRDPLNSRILRKGVFYRVPAPPGGLKRELDPETLAIIQRGREKRIREYLDRRRRRA